MKVSTEYSESIEVMPGLWRKHGITIQQEEGETLDPDEMNKLAVNYVRKWHEEHKTSGAVNPNWDHGTIPVKQIEKQSYDQRVNAMLADISACTTIEELKTYRHVANANVYANSMYESKLKSLEELSK